MFDKYEEYFKNKNLAQDIRIFAGSHDLKHGSFLPYKLSSQPENHYYEYIEAIHQWVKIKQTSPPPPEDWGPGEYDGEIRKA